MNDRVQQAQVSVELPLPPSTNRAFAARNGSHRTMKTGITRFWMKQCKEEVSAMLPRTFGLRAVKDELAAALPRLFGGPYGLWIDLPKGMQGDIDNRVKLLSDMLCQMKGNITNDFGLGIVKDDRQMAALYVGRIRMPPERCVATVVILEDWPAYVALRIGF
jgi:Holliday junction resolvase RusA-like endonuclease